VARQIERNFETIARGGVTLRCVVEGDGPLVILLHGFPQCWYLWRHQIDPLVAAGYQVAVPDQRGYGGSDAPEDVTAYDIIQLTDDVVGVADALGHRQFVVVGHDWGAPVAWHTALLHPARVRAVAGLAVPYARLETPQLMTRQEFWGDRFWYIVYFQQPGIAEAELDADLRRSLRLTYYAASADFRGNLMAMEKPKTAGFLDGIPEPTQELSWLSEDDLDYYVAQYRRNGFRGPLNWYRNLERNVAITPQLRDERVSQTAYFLAGAQDPVLAFPGDWLGAMDKWVPNLAGKELIEGAGHWVPMERPEAVTEHLLRFLGTL
jgi:pimeloyl-ACP methyl ester carboxylesterase